MNKNPKPAGRWYVLNKHDMATLCKDEDDARKAAPEYDQQWPNVAPHRVALLVDAPAADPAWAASVPVGVLTAAPAPADWPEQSARVLTIEEAAADLLGVARPGDALAPSEQAAHDMGAKGGPVVEAERLAFEAWMRGHCWALSAHWTGSQYVNDAEAGGDLDPRAMQTRRLWAAWRDRAALSAAAPAPVAQHLPHKHEGDTPTAVGNLISAMNRWKATTPTTARPAFNALVRACAELVQAAAPAPVAQPASRMSATAKRKAADLMAQGYEVAGYVLEKEGNRSAVLWDAAVRWATPDERHRLMHVDGSLAATAPVAQGELVAMIQMRCRGGSWREVKPTRTDPTPEIRADYLMKAHPGVYEVRRLCIAAPAPVLTPAQAHADELVEALRSAITCSHADHGRRSVNQQAWDRLVQAVAMVVHGIEATGQEGKDHG